MSRPGLLLGVCSVVANAIPAHLAARWEKFPFPRLSKAWVSEKAQTCHRYCRLVVNLVMCELIRARMHHRVIGRERVESLDTIFFVFVIMKPSVGAIGAVKVGYVLIMTNAHHYFSEMVNRLCCVRC